MSGFTISIQKVHKICTFSFKSYRHFHKRRFRPRRRRPHLPLVQKRTHDRFRLRLTNTWPFLDGHFSYFWINPTLKCLMLHFGVYRDKPKWNHKASWCKEMKKTRLRSKSLQSQHWKADRRDYFTRECKFGWDVEWSQIESEEKLTQIRYR
jgi:hypothetical protein